MSSDEVKEQADAGCENDNADKTLQEDDPFDLLKAENETLKNELKTEKENTLRVAADFDNLRKRLLKDTDERIKFANQSIILDFLSVSDNLEMAIAHIKDENAGIKPLKEGISYVLKQFKDTIEKYGAKEITVKEGEPFNPNFHDAMMLDCDENYDNNAVTLVMQKGYTLNERVIRPCKVKVNKIENKNTKEEDNE